LGEVRGVDPARARADRHDGVALVEFPREQGADLEFGELLADPPEFALRLIEGIGVVLLLGHLHEGLQVVDRLLEVSEALELRLRLRELARDLLRAIRVVPQVGGRGLLGQLRDACFELLGMGDGSDGGVRVPQRLNFVRKVDDHAQNSTLLLDRFLACAGSYSVILTSLTRDLSRSGAAGSVTPLQFPDCRSFDRSNLASSLTSSTPSGETGQLPGELRCSSLGVK